jgi:hypothetical protein
LIINLRPEAIAQPSSKLSSQTTRNNVVNSMLKKKKEDNNKKRKLETIGLKNKQSLEVVGGNEETDAAVGPVKQRRTKLTIENVCVRYHLYIYL